MNERDEEEKKKKKKKVTTRRIGWASSKWRILVGVETGCSVSIYERKRERANE